jgi:hypothetical protein
MQVQQKRARWILRHNGVSHWVVIGWQVHRDPKQRENCPGHFAALWVAGEQVLQHGQVST